MSGVHPIGGTTLPGHSALTLRIYYRLPSESIQLYLRTHRSVATWEAEHGQANERSGKRKRYASAGYHRVNLDSERTTWPPIELPPPNRPLYARTSTTRVLFCAAWLSICTCHAAPPYSTYPTSTEITKTLATCVRPSKWPLTSQGSPGAISTSAGVRRPDSFAGRLPDSHVLRRRVLLSQAQRPHPAFTHPHQGMRSWLYLNAESCSSNHCLSSRVSSAGGRAQKPNRLTGG